MPEGFKGVALDEGNDRTVGIEGDDIELAIKTLNFDQEKSDWYFVRVLNAKSCNLAAPKFYMQAE